jgi:hypothetical protein
VSRPTPGYRSDARTSRSVIGLRNRAGEDLSTLAAPIQSRDGIYLGGFPVVLPEAVTLTALENPETLPAPSWAVTL